MSRQHKPSVSTSSNASQYPIPSLCSSVSSTASSVRSIPFFKIHPTPSAAPPHNEPMRLPASSHRHREHKPPTVRHRLSDASANNPSPAAIQAATHDHLVTQITNTRHVSFHDTTETIPDTLFHHNASPAWTDELDHHRPSSSEPLDDPTGTTSFWSDDSLALELADDEEEQAKNSSHFIPRWMQPFIIRSASSSKQISTASDGITSCVNGKVSYPSGRNSSSSSSSSDSSTTSSLMLHDNPCRQDNPKQLKRQRSAPSHVLSLSLRKLKTFLFLK